MAQPARKTSSVLTNLFYLLFSVSLIVINVTRILKVPLTEDEANNHYHSSYWEFIHMDNVTANVHILNSIARKFFVETFADNDFFLRLDSLIAQIVFIIFGILICRKTFKKGVWQIGLFILLNLNPYAFEFWGYSRGYAMSVGFMIMSIYFLLCHLENKKQKFLWLSLFGAILAVYSNFTVLNYYLALGGVLVLAPGIFKDEQGKALYIKRIISLVVSTLILALLITGPIIKLRQANQLFFGGEGGLFMDTLMSIVKDSFFIEDDGTRFVLITSYIIAASIWLAGIYWLYLFLKRRIDNAAKNGIIFWLLLVICCIAVKLQHELLDTKYLLARTALFMIPLYFLSLLSFMEHSARGLVNYINGILLTGIVCIFSFNFINHITLDKSKIWWFNNYDLVVLERVVNESRTNPKKINMRVCWLFVGPMGQDIALRYPGRFENMEWTDAPPKADDTSYDFYYIAGDEVKYVSPRYEVDTCFFEGKYCLLRKK